MSEVYHKNLLKKAFFPWHAYFIHNLDSPIKMDMQIQSNVKHLKT